MNENAILNGSMTLDMIYHPVLAQVYRFYQYFMLFSITPLIAFAVYIIHKKSPSEMNICKMLLINQLFWSYALDVTLTIWQPINLVPYFMGYSVGIAGHLGPYGVYTMICITYFMYGGQAQSVMLMLIFRVSRVYKTSNFEYGTTWLKFGIALFIAIEVILAIPVIIWLATQNIEDINTFREDMIAAQPIMKELFALEPSANGLNWSRAQFVTFGCIYYGIGLILFTLFLFLNIALFVGKMKHLGFHASSTTHRLQIVLFRTLMVQIMMCFVTIAFPIIVLTYFISTKNPYGSYYTQLALFLLSFHGIADTISILYFIRPYRTYLVEVLKKILRRESSNKVTTSPIYFT